MKLFKTALFAFLLLCLTGLTASAVEQQRMSVQVKKGEVRSSPSFLGRIVTRLSYGEQVEVFEKRGPWLRVGLPGSTTGGWMHSSALTYKKIVLRAGAQDVQTTVSGEELALAGKGFNAQVEGRFQARNPNVDFAWIDRMEKIVVSQQQMRQFLKAGGLSPQGGM